MKKIAVMGTHGVGKTTLCKSIIDKAKYDGRRVESVGEVVRDCPYPINQCMSYKACEWIILEQISRERKAERNNPEIIVCDRACYDPVVYFRHINPKDTSYIEKDMVDQLANYAIHFMKTYDAIVWVESEVKSIEGDGFRDTGLSFHHAIDEAFGLVADHIIEYEITKFLNFTSTEVFSDITATTERIMECLY